MKDRFLIKLLCIVCAASLFFAAAACAPQEHTYTSAEAEEMIRSAFDDYRKEAENDPDRKKEVTPEPLFGYDDLPVCTIELNGNKMQYLIEVIGEPDGSGLYPLYITLHGGGGGEGAEEENTSQWLSMFEYYKPSVTSGIYVSCRGMDDVWNMHFLDQSYPMYDRLIEDMILFMNADPDRVYLLGFSAGGDGVYAVAPRMADRFAAANVSSGHPNGVSLINTANLPFMIQAGIRDFYSEDAMRSLRAAEFEEILNDLHDKYGFGYTHRVLIHVPEGHNFDDNSPYETEYAVLEDPSDFAKRADPEYWLEEFMDVYADHHDGIWDISALSYSYNEEDFNDDLYDLITKDLKAKTVETDTNAVRYVSQFKRDPHPEHVVWDLSTRAGTRQVSSFYWLKADLKANKGIIKADFDPASNTFTITPPEDFSDDLYILIHPAMVDIEKPVTFITPDKKSTMRIVPDREMIKESLKETGDPKLSWIGMVNIRDL